MITSGPLEVTNSIIANNYGESGVIYVDEEYTFQGTIPQ